MQNNKIQYNNIDLFKFIFAIVVVMIHTTPFMDISESASWFFSNTVANLAVPFFFVTSGFLLFGKLANCGSDRRDETVKKYLVHIVRMYLIWCIIWIPWKALNYYNIGSFTTTDFVKYIRDIIFVSGGDALWYLPALATAVGIVYLLRYKLNLPKESILILSFILYIAGCLISSWYKMFENNIIVQTYYDIFVTVDNGLLCGMVYVAIGMFIAEKDKCSNILFDAIGFIVLFSLMIVECHLINEFGFNRNGVANIIMLPAAVFVMFRLILNIRVSGREDVFRRLRDYSTLMYLSHCFIIRSIKLVAGIFDVNISYVVLFIITLMLSLAFAAIVRYLSTNKKCTWIKLIY